MTVSDDQKKKRNRIAFISNSELGKQYYKIFMEYQKDDVYFWLFTSFASFLKLMFWYKGTDLDFKSVYTI